MAPRTSEARSFAVLMLGVLNTAVLWVLRRPARLERALYVAFAAACTLWVAHQFWSSMSFQLFLAQNQEGFLRARAPWSAPLDDVFIHFDFARSAARGFPFQWSEGNGYSSGGTSLSYPFVLALGYRLGYQGDQLMVWAGMVACASVLCTLIAARTFARGLPRWCSWWFPPVLLSTGVLNWTLMSGMEVAFFLALWGACAVACFHCRHLEPKEWGLGPTLGLGALGALMTATRPESAVLVACFSLLLTATHFPRTRPLVLFARLLASAAPGALVVVAHTVANKVFTGEFSAAGALAKLEMHDPYLSSEAVRSAWWFHLEYQVLRVTNYHFSSLTIPVPGLHQLTSWLNATWPALHFFPVSGVSTGWAAWLLAVLPLTDRRTRWSSILLWSCTWSFMAVVALNGQVRWQNERYTMPAVAWLLLNAGLGLGVASTWLSSAWRHFRARSRRIRYLRPGLAASLAGILALGFGLGQTERYTGQRWFFGRAARNIWDQHVHTGEAIRTSPMSPRRILVGDAGAIPYVADRPALDIIGLGGYRDLPFARATRVGLGAAVELLERMAPDERPDLMALYPSWWGDLPIWFGQELWSMPVSGNVICGGREKVVYRPDWSAFAGSHRPVGALPRERVVAELDLADLVSERAAETAFVGAPGHVAMKLLPYPGDRRRDLWDAGRTLPPNTALEFTSRTHTPQRPMRWLLRVAPAQPTRIHILSNGSELTTLDLEPSDGWLEPAFDLPDTRVDPELRLRFEVELGELVLHHVWGLQSK